MGALDDGERISVPDAVAWRSWLEVNHSRSGGAWLLRARPGTTGVYVAYEDAVRQALCFGWVDGPTRTFNESVGGLWFAPRRPSSGWAATNKARVAELEVNGLLAPAGVRAIEAAKANGAWTILDGPEAGIEPPDLTAALDAVPEARAAWDSFPASAKKLGLTNIAMAKRSETRTKRITAIVDAATEGRRP